MPIVIEGKGTVTNSFVTVCAWLSGIGFMLLVVLTFFGEQSASYPPTLSELWEYLRTTGLTDTLWICLILWNLVINAVVIGWLIGSVFLSKFTK